MSDAATQVASQNTHMQSQEGTAGCSLSQSVCASWEAAKGPDVMSTSSDSHSSDCMAAAEPMTQDLTVADSENEICMQPLQAASACLSDLMCNDSPPGRLCLDLSPDTLPELRQKAVPQAGIEGPSTGRGLEFPVLADAAAAPEATHQGVHDTLMHDTPWSPFDKAIPTSFHTAAVNSPLTGAASDNKTGAVEESEPCMPGLAASTSTDAPVFISHNASAEHGCLTAATNPEVASGAALETTPTGATAAHGIMPSDSRHSDPHVVSSDQLQQRLLESHVSHTSVTAFLWSAVRHIVPQVLHPHTHTLRLASSSYA